MVLHHHKCQKYKHAYQIHIKHTSNDDWVMAFWWVVILNIMTIIVFAGLPVWYTVSITGTGADWVTFYIHKYLTFFHSVWDPIATYHVARSGNGSTISSPGSFGFQFMEILKIRKHFWSNSNKADRFKQHQRNACTNLNEFKTHSRKQYKYSRSWSRFYTKGRGDMQLIYQICVYNIQTFLSDFTVLLVWGVLMPITRFMYPCTLHAW